MGYLSPFGTGNFAVIEAKPQFLQQVRNYACRVRTQIVLHLLFAGFDVADNGGGFGGNFYWACVYQPYWGVGILGVFAVGGCVFAAGVGAVNRWAAGAFFVVENGVAIRAGAGL